MKLIRAVVFTLSLVLLGAGYAVSQISYFRDGTAPNCDVPALRRVALILLIACAVFPFLGKADKEVGK